MMKASIGRLRRFAFHKVDAKDKGEFLPTAQIDELARAAKDMQDMRECYDRLLSAAAATANSAYEFSESLGEMGSCLEKIAPHSDEESGKILSMLGRVQFDLQRLVDNYRTNIFKTITHPSESLLNELRTVEDMKRQCDEKRDVFEYMMAHVKEKGRPKGKGENFVSHQLQAAHNEFHDEATLCLFRLKSLKQGQSRSLLTQAARHHTAQMRMFRDGIKSLEAVEQHVRIAAEKQHIDCELSVHGNEMEDNEDDDDDDQCINEDRELSFNCGMSTRRVEALSTPRSSMKAEDADLSFPRPSATEPATMYAYKKEEHQASSHDHRASSHSAPLFLEKKPDLTDRLRQMNPSVMAQAANAYVLPTPIDSRYNPAPQTSNAKPTSQSGNIWHSSPLEHMKNGKDTENSNNISTRLPRPSVERESNDVAASQKAARHAFSGPLVSKPFSAKPISTETFSGAVSRLPVPTPVAMVPHQSSSSPKVSPGASPPLASPPRVSELHELPTPPPPLLPRHRPKSSALAGHSAPLTAWSQDSKSTVPSSTSIVASPLPVPPLIVPRSFSIPSRNQRTMAQGLPEKNQDAVASPPLTPMSLMNHRSPSRAQTGQARGGS
ncbi:PREDICTED: uncharacterized protein At2g33490 [Tarenaya hassleriana]|uniref:uncharacterized protein At2g33490 n=1 Tax=Tarenaya hassleriana TaxID=28532 RepID=UPI00053C3281|nr:PREDICTED: uncharacterized protein At2g33490 [Tarenaya hassleriana]